MATTAADTEITCGGCLIGFPLGTGIHTLRPGCLHERVTCACGARRQKAEACATCASQERRLP